MLSDSFSIRRRLAWAAALLPALALGCASPGPPHAPSLNLPKPPNDLTARRSGNHVELQFTAPMRSTDNLPLKPLPIRTTLCRQLPGQACVDVPAAAREIAPSKTGAPNLVTFSDDLPPELTHGPAKLLRYRVKLFNSAGQSADSSEPAFTATGDAPPMVDSLRAQGSRLGVLLEWTPAPNAGDVVLEREDLSVAATPAKRNGNAPANLVRLEANSSGRTLDTTAKPGVPYRYTALRERTVQLGGRAIELHSAPSNSVTFTLQLIYAPVAPTALTAAGYLTAATPTAPAFYAVDLVWQPVDETSLLAGLTGYNIYREALDAEGRPTTPRLRLNTAPAQVPAFRDETANPTERYRYSVTAIDSKGNESPATTAVLEPDAKP